MKYIKYIFNTWNGHEKKFQDLVYFGQKVRKLRTCAGIYVLRENTWQIVQANSHSLKTIARLHQNVTCKMIDRTRKIHSIDGIIVNITYHES